MDSSLLVSPAKIASTLREVALRYPERYIAHQLRDIPRIAFNLDLVQKLVQKKSPVIADVGGGWGLFSPGAAALGWRSTLIDDFRGADIQDRETDPRLLPHRETGVIIQLQDVAVGLSLPANHFDAVTCFETLEHLHGGVRRAFRTIVDSIQPGGWFVLSGPNCVNIRKRITVPLGFGKWSPLQLWYEEEFFGGHVREPDVEDLRFIARDLGLKQVKIFGRNWTGTDRPGIRQLMPIADPLLRLRPSLCSNIYMVGSKA